jgi:chondroitin 4-sulfotransferase 11
MIINHQHRFIFIHIQKTAGSSITEALNRLDGSQQLGYQHSMMNSLETAIYEGYWVFCFVRNPFDRLVSWWNMMMHKGIHNDFSRYLLSNSSNFSEFLDCTEVIDDQNALIPSMNEPYPKSIAFNQLDYITGKDGRLAVHFIGRFESLQADFKRISDAIGVQLVLPHSNAYERKHYREYYSPGDVEKVRRMYKRDLKFFGYDF